MVYTPPGQPSDSNIPGEVARLAATYSLGPFFKAYRAEERTRAMLIGCPILILGFPLVCGVSITLVVLSYGISHAIGITGHYNIPQLILGGIALFIMGIFGRVAIRAGWTINASGTVVYLFQNGIIHSKGARQMLLLWQHIVRGQLLDATGIYPPILVIKTLDRRIIRLHSVNDLSELAERVQQALAHRQLAQH